MTRAPRSDAVRNRARALAAADALFADAEVPSRVSMDDVAAAAGVGKGTLFRAFGDRAGLIQAVWTARYDPLQQAIADGPPPLGPGTEPRRRIAAILDAVVAVKLDNRHLTLALEETPVGASLYDQPQYHRLHRLLSALLRDAGLLTGTDLIAHALLAATRADLVVHLTGGAGVTSDRLRADLAALVDLVLGA